MINRVKYNRTLKTVVSNQDKELTVLEWLEEPIKANKADVGDQPDWLNLPDLAFNEIMMMKINLYNCTQVCSSWKERITKNILENPAKKNIIKARIERAMGPHWSIFPSNEDICNAKWLSK